MSGDGGERSHVRHWESGRRCLTVIRTHAVEQVAKVVKIRESGRDPKAAAALASVQAYCSQLPACARDQGSTIHYE